MATETEPDNNTLLRGCFDGNERAIRTFYDRFNRLIYAAIHGWINKSATEADRVEDVQEVFHNVLILIMEDGFSRLKGLREVSKISGYLYMMAYNETGRYFHEKWREDKRKTEEAATTEADDLIEKLSQDDRRRIVAELMEALSERERSILECFYGEEMSYSGIAGRLGLTTSNVGVMISRIKEKCVKFIKSKYGERL
ncbi:MAG: sigma-70 family RNA polymerase sigma factor [Candidatus Omnitrophota bacterium]